MLVVAVPLTFALFMYAGIQNQEQQNRAQEAVQEGLASDVRSMQDLVSQGRATLDTFGITFAIQAQRWDLAQGNADRLRALHPEYAVIVAADATGRIRASSPTATHTVDISSQDSFQRAVSTRSLAVSDYGIDPVTGNPAITVSLPVYNAKNRLVSVEYIAFDPARFAARLSNATGASEATIIDSRGTLVGRMPALPAIVGRNVGAERIIRAAVSQTAGSATLPGLDGIKRHYYFAPVFSNGEGGLHAIVGLSEAELLAPGRRAFMLTLAGFAIFAVIALVIAWLIGTYSIYRPTVILQDAAERLSKGDLTARAEFGHREDELGTLRDRFNEMATSLERHVGDLDEARKELHVLNTDLEERVKRRTIDLEAANKELEAFSYSVSHDLRSPLRAIDGYSLALLEDCSDVLGDQGRSDLTRVRVNANRMGELIDGLLRLSRLSRQELKTADVDLSAVANAVTRCLYEVDPDRVVTFKIEPGVHGNGDRELLRIALDNLMGNAWKFTGQHETATIEFGATVVDGETVYFVRDDGAGFDMAYAGKLFGAFQRVHGQAEFPGTGIGLATAARIVRRHGGRIWAEGEPEKGATFWFTLS